MRKPRLSAQLEVSLHPDKINFFKELCFATASNKSLPPESNIKFSRRFKYCKLLKSFKAIEIRLAPSGPKIFVIIVNILNNTSYDPFNYFLLIDNKIKTILIIYLIYSLPMKYL